MADISGMEMQTHLQVQLQTVAQRIVEAARLAAAAHLHGSLSETSEHYGRRIGIGGAGPVTPGGTEDSRLPARGQRVERVTHDEFPAPPPSLSTRRNWHNPAD